MKKEILETIVNYTVEDINDSLVINAVLEDINLNHKGLKFSINQEDIILEKGTKGVGMFYDENNLETKTIEYNSHNEIMRIIEYDNYPNGEAKWIRSYDKEGNLLSEDFYEEEFWED